MIREQNAKPHEVDGTRVRGYLSGVGCSGLTLMVQGRTARWKFGEVASVAPRVTLKGWLRGGRS